MSPRPARDKAASPGNAEGLLLGKVRPLKIGTGPLTVQEQKTHRDFPDQRASGQHPCTSVLSPSPQFCGPEPQNRAWPLIDCWVSGAGTLGPAGCRSLSQDQGFLGTCLPECPHLLLSCSMCREQKRSVIHSRVGRRPVQIMCEGGGVGTPQVSLNGGRLEGKHTSPWVRDGPCAGTHMVSVICCKFNCCEGGKKENFFT